MPKGSGERWRFDNEGESARRWVAMVRGFCRCVSNCHLVFSSSRRCCVSASQILFSRSSAAAASCAVVSAAVSLACSLLVVARCSARSCSRVLLRSLRPSSSSSRRRALELASRALRLRSDSRFAASSRSFSRAVTRDVSVVSMPCQFSEAREYCVWRVSICRSSFAWESPVAEEDASSERLRRSSSFDSRFCWISQQVLGEGVGSHVQQSRRATPVQ